MSDYFRLASSVERDRSLREPADVLLSGPPIIVWEERSPSGLVVFVSRAPGELTSFHCRTYSDAEALFRDVDRLVDRFADSVSKSLSKYRLRVA